MTFNATQLIDIFDLKRAIIRGHNLMASCPFGTHEDIHPSFGICLDTGKYNCYSCGEKGTNIRFLAIKLKIFLPDDLMLSSLMIVETGYNKLIKTYDYTDNVIDFIPYYLLIKGISLNALKRFKVSYEKNDLKFPCILPDGNLYGWVIRNEYWSNKYGFRPIGVDRRNLLFGLDRKIKRCYLVESMTDMLKLVSFHVEAVSTCGNIIFDNQANWLIKYCDEVILVPQNDKYAEKWIRDAKKKLLGKVKLYEIKISPSFKDVGDINYTKNWWDKDSFIEQKLF